jgi:molybdate transport system ATP-binding protein
VLIRLHQASVYLGRQPALRDIHWELRAGEHWVVTGPNGSGKSTLLRLIAGDVHPALGGLVQRFDLTSKDTLWDLRRRIGYVSPAFQAAYRENLSGLEVVASGFRSSVGLLDKPTPAEIRQATGLARRLGLSSLARRNTLDMSYGEFRRILLARALVHDPRLLVLDEPLDGLDAMGRRAMSRVLEEVARGGTSLVLVTHHGEDWPRCLTHHARLEAGRLVAQGPISSRD